MVWKIEQQEITLIGYSEEFKQQSGNDLAAFARSMVVCLHPFQICRDAWILLCSPVGGGGGKEEEGI